MGLRCGLRSMRSNVGFMCAFAAQGMLRFAVAGTYWRTNLF